MDEFAVCQAGARADLAVINGHLGGFEIKSEVDNLARLPRQARFFGQIFDAMTIVCAPRHVQAASRGLPKWWNVWSAEPRDGTIDLKVVREGTHNPAPSPVARVSLLRREEMVAILVDHNFSGRIANAPRRVLIPTLLSELTPAALDEALRSRLRHRHSALLVR